MQQSTPDSYRLCCVRLCARHTFGHSRAVATTPILASTSVHATLCRAGTRQWWCALTMETPLRQRMDRRHQPLSLVALRQLARPPLRAGLGGMATALPQGTKLGTCLCGDCPNLARQVSRLGPGDTPQLSATSKPRRHLVQAASAPCLPEWLQPGKVLLPCSRQTPDLPACSLRPGPSQVCLPAQHCARAGRACCAQSPPSSCPALVQPCMLLPALPLPVPGGCILLHQPPLAPLDSLPC